MRGKVEHGDPRRYEPRRGGADTLRGLLAEAGKRQEAAEMMTEAAGAER